MDFRAAAFIVSLIVATCAGLFAVIKFYVNSQKEIEHLRQSNNQKSLNRFDDEIKEFKLSVTSIQTTIRELTAGLAQNRSDVAVLKERLDETKRLLERFEKTQTDTVRNMIKSEITELTKTLMLIRTKKVGP